MQLLQVLASTMWEAPLDPARLTEIVNTAAEGSNEAGSKKWRSLARGTIETAGLRALLLEPRYLQSQSAPDQASAAAPTPPSQPEAKEASFAAGRWYAGKERGTKLSQSRVLTEREMEMIELGGAPS
jgi:hypothetical protein